LPPWLRVHLSALKVPTPETWPEKTTVPRGELTFRLGLSVSTTVAVQVLGSPRTTTAGTQVR